MPYTPAREDLGHDATPDWEQVARLEIGTPLAAIAHKAYPTVGRWTIVGWRYIGTNGWADVDSDGVCYAQGHVHYPATDDPARYRTLTDPANA